MPSFNRTVLLGHLTRDIEIRFVGAKNTAVCDLGLAVNDRVKRNDSWEDETTFVDVTLWGRNAEIAEEYTSKGSLVLVEGRLKMESWEDKSGNKRTKIKVVGDRLVLLKTGSQMESKPRSSQKEDAANIPF